MRKYTNLMLRGGVYYLRVTVPKRLQVIRTEQGERSSKEVWKSLGTGDLRAARAAMTQVKADVFREFEAEERRFRDRPTPTVDQLREIGAKFGRLVRASLSNERLLTLPSAPDVEAAEAELAALDVVMEATTDQAQWEALASRYFDIAWIPLASEDHQQARDALCGRLWACLETLDYRLVHPFIQQAARSYAYRIDADGDAYRQLAHLMLKEWIGALSGARAAFLGLDEPLLDQDEVLERWHRASASNIASAPAIVAPESIATIPMHRDIRKLFALYLQEKFPRIARNALQDKERTIQQFVEVAGNKDVALYRKTDVTAYKNMLVRLPVNAGRDFVGKTMEEVIHQAPAGAKRLAAKTVRSRLAILGSFGRWASENTDGVNAANFRTTAPVAKKPETPVREFNDMEVGLIFQAKAFTGCASERNQQQTGPYKIRDYRYWLPLLAAYTGCRLNELTQLRVDDVCEIGGISAIRITDSGEGQSLKTKSSERLVPIHRALLDAGFIDMVNRVRASGHRDLFPEIPVGRNGRRSEAAGKWFRKFLVRIGLKDAGARGGIHRFRHSVVQKLRDRGHSDPEIALIVGHETKVAPMTAGYGSSRLSLLRQQSAILESIEYEGVVLAP